ncbi:hypothetical protein NYP20_17325 [Pseudomonas sp. N3-W]|jgi:hypothetical protein|uniref:Uncharacterized protein n=1 Tax=Pseudomonas fungipugnans TaxID=3024217 RepID=A0ABT6QIF0_9PSED|nr:MULTISPECIES: hypothetical protein [unclassified Pseudomonas]MDI2590665.1 hypothetical protein [Pseudomonas sp. 681]UWF47107.1 hypothetical protein NYP20_17325 [Pseudomonas sp. N3-W]
MQILVKLNGGHGTTVIELPDHSTRAAAMPLILAAYGLDPAAPVQPILLAASNSRPIGATEALQNEGNYQLIHRPQFVPQIDDEVLLLLTIRLNHLQAHPRPRHLIFISTGSHINGEKGALEAANQQCPDDVVKHCLGHDMSLSVMLIDADFQNPHQVGQIYHHDHNWQVSPPQLLLGKVRHFRHSVTDFKLSTYQSHLENWGQPSPQLAGFNLAALGDVTNDMGGQLVVRMYNGNITFNSQPDLPLGVY